MHIHVIIFKVVKKQQGHREDKIVYVHVCNVYLYAARYRTKNLQYQQRRDLELEVENEEKPICFNSRRDKGTRGRRVQESSQLLLSKSFRFPEKKYRR